MFPYTEGVHNSLTLLLNWVSLNTATSLVHFGSLYIKNLESQARPQSGLFRRPCEVSNKWAALFVEFSCNTRNIFHHLLPLFHVINNDSIQPCLVISLRKIRYLRVLMSKLKGILLQIWWPSQNICIPENYSAVLGYHFS